MAKPTYSTDSGNPQDQHTPSTWGFLQPTLIKGTKYVVTALSILYLIYSQDSLITLRKSNASTKKALHALSIHETDPTLAANVSWINRLLYPESDISKGIHSEIISSITKPKSEVVSTYRFNRSVLAVGFSPDGSTFLTASTDHKAHLWNSTTLKFVELAGHEDNVTSVAFSPSGKKMVTGSADHSIRLWKESGKELMEFTGHLSTVSALDFHPSGDYVISGSEKGVIKLWSTWGVAYLSLQAHQGDITSLHFSQGGGIILSGSTDGKLKIWTFENNKISERSTISIENMHILSAIFSPDDERLLVGLSDGTARLLNTSGEELIRYTGHREGVSAVAFSPDGKSVLTGSLDHTAKLWTLYGLEQACYLGHNGSVNGVAFSPDGKRVLTGASGFNTTDYVAQLWFTKGMELTAQHFNHSQLYSLSQSVDSELLLSGHADYTARLWSSAGKPLSTYQGHTDMVTAASFSPDGKAVITGSLDKTARLY
ncbi:MAG: hypothetical protein AAF655_01580, partial [Bacteroidota bacterium]